MAIRIIAPPGPRPPNLPPGTIYDDELGYIIIEPDPPAPQPPTPQPPTPQPPTPAPTPTPQPPAGGYPRPAPGYPEGWVIIAPPGHAPPHLPPGTIYDDELGYLVPPPRPPDTPRPPGEEPPKPPPAGPCGPRPGSAPATIPAWAWVRLELHRGVEDSVARWRRGQARGEHPRTLPGWFWPWAAWRDCQDGVAHAPPPPFETDPPDGDEENELDVRADLEAGPWPTEEEQLAHELEAQAHEAV